MSNLDVLTARYVAAPNILRTPSPPPVARACAGWLAVVGDVGLNLFRPAVRPVTFQKTATEGKPYCLGPRWHIPVMRCAANDACGGSSDWGGCRSFRYRVVGARPTSRLWCGDQPKNDCHVKCIRSDRVMVKKKSISSEQLQPASVLPFSRN